MPLDSTKTLDDLHGEGLFRVGGVKNERFLFPAKKAVDVCQAVGGEMYIFPRARRGKSVDRNPDQEAATTNSQQQCEIEMYQLLLGTHFMMKMQDTNTKL